MLSLFLILLKLHTKFSVLQVRSDCQYFEWYDVPMCQHGRRVVKKMKEMHIECDRKLMKANEELQKHKKMKKVYRLIMGVCCMVVIWCELKGGL